MPSAYSDGSPIEAHNAAAYAGYVRAIKTSLDALPDYAKRLMVAQNVPHLVAPVPGALPALPRQAYESAKDRGVLLGVNLYSPARYLGLVPRYHTISYVAWPHNTIDPSLPHLQDARQAQGIVNHEAAHAISLILSDVYRQGLGLKDAYGLFEGRIKASAHRPFAEAYAKDLEQVRPPRAFNLSMSYFLPSDKGGAHRQIDAAREEAFGHALGLVFGGAFFPGADGPARRQAELSFRRTFPNLMAAAERLHQDLQKLSRDNPGGSGFMAAVAAYMRKLDGLPPARAATPVPASPATPPRYTQLSPPGNASPSARPGTAPASTLPVGATRGVAPGGTLASPSAPGSPAARQPGARPSAPAPRRLF